MDNIDTAILDCLKENGRVTASEISKKVKLSIPAVAERIRKLEQNSIIQKYWGSSLLHMNWIIFKCK